jgi:hypothetical protein
MLQLVDPSSRSVLFGNPKTGKVAGVPTDGFRFVVESYDPSKPTSGGAKFPRDAGSSGFADPAIWTWPTWESPQWHAEVKPLFAAMQKAFAGIPDRPPGR